MSSPEPLRFVGPGGDTVSDPGPVDEVTLLRLFEAMVLLRTFDERAVALQRQGRIGTYPLFWGEEATQAGPALACSDRDWLFPSYRQNAVGILRGLSPATPLRYRRGLGGELGFYDPRAHRVAPICIPIATHLPHAVGVGMAARKRGDDVAVLVWFGDGATSEGDFHEAMNFASVFRAPVVFFCVNNKWAISTPWERQSATETVAEKAAAYGMPSLRVDGFDVLACHRAAADALAHARAGGGPTLVEADCYRLGGHATADDPTLYRDQAAAEERRRGEPVARFASWLRARAVLDDASEAAVRDRAAAAISAAVTDMEAVAKPDPRIMFDFVYGSGPHPALQAQARTASAAPDAPGAGEAHTP